MSQPSELAQQRAEDFRKFKNYAALGFIVAAPIIIALPPRKLDLYTASLTTAFIISADHLLTERTGKGIVSQIAGYLPTGKPSIVRDLPTKKAEEFSERMRLARTQEQEIERLRVSRGEEEEQKSLTLQESVKKLWMGKETEGWQERRREEERKALAEGKGYADIIMDYIRDAWRMDEGGEQGDNAEKKPAEQQEKGSTS
ncbi:hypothetical protein MGYG_07792 [Nannizzia gypsea CBS 118893]|uniref:Rhomboid family membrane protein n=1 Tax=Arthroderma gypseum (strain ATCC MYA-4604 / CBS 118893) TaxID=535722 RepID=E4V461_ARTGP|nr:hypothetical protein MGYG_07792 [Nannizzia gypsea CBS 118893]EFR04785.1 hypothetical protein MGYG_07792 [Nannizzia gypsea CBS 118893]